MRHSLLPVFLAFIAFAPTANSATFFLTSEDNRKFGPFEYKQDAAVIAGRSEFSIHKSSANSAIVKKLESIILPEVDVRQANILDVVRFLSDQSAKFDTIGKPGESKGVDIRLRPSLGDLPDAPFEGVADVPLITFRAQNIALIDALSIVVELTGLKYVITSDAVNIQRPDEPDGEFITRTYDSSSLLNDAILTCTYTFYPETQMVPDEYLKLFFSWYGVEWPRGSSISLTPSSSQIVATNTGSNLMQLDAALHSLEVLTQSSQVETEVQFLEFNRTDIADIASDGFADIQELMNLRKAGKGELIAAPKVTTKSGSEAVTKCVEEITYPTDFLVIQPTETNTNSKTEASGSAIVPDGFECREVGTILLILPEVSQDGSSISLSLSPQMVSKPEWKDYGGKYIDANGRKQTAKMEQPFFHVCTTTTSILTRNGETILFGGGIPGTNSSKWVYMIVNSRRIGMDGKPLTCAPDFHSINMQKDEFILVTDKGREMGPFEFKQGALVNLENSKFTVSDITQDTKGLLQRMKDVIIPEIDFKEARVEDVLWFLSEQSNPFDAINQNIRTKRIDIVLNPEPDRTNTPTISFRAHNISILEALKTMSAMSDLKFGIRNGVVMVTHKDEPDGMILHSAFNVSQYIDERIQSSAQAPDNNPTLGSSPSASNAGWQRFFASLGVPWPRGSYIQYIPDINKAFIANTAENIELFSNILSQNNTLPCQIDIEVQFVEFNQNDIAALSVNGPIDLDALMELRKAGKAELLAAPKVLTKSGSEATVKGVTEIIYPSYFEVCQDSSDTNTDDVVTTIASVVEPEFFQTREIGALLTVLPEVSPNGRLINVSLTPMLTVDTEWKDYGGKYVDMNLNEQTARMEQPFVGVDSTTTSIVIESGKTAILGGGTPGTNPNKVVYTFVSARLIGADGIPL